MARSVARVSRGRNPLPQDAVAWRHSDTRTKSGRGTSRRVSPVPPPLPLRREKAVNLRKMADSCGS